MKIALYGIGGTYNFGCEAIVRGTEKIIHSAYPDAVIDYYSYDYENDKNRICDVNVNIIPIYSSQIKLFADKVLTKLNLSNLSLDLRFGWVKQYDYVLSIGGDIYTLPPANEYQNNQPYTNSLLEFGNFCRLKGVKLIIWGASVGTFDECEPIKKVFFEHFNTCISHITVREHSSEKYLKANGFDKCSFYCDPAFVIETTQEAVKENAIGINLSPLSNNYIAANISADEIINKQVNTIIEISKKSNKKILLLAHVMSHNKMDDDFSYLNLIFDKLNKVKVDCELIKCNSFCEVKKVIQNCDFVISARMHCAINAIASGVPAIFLSYSEKSRGMSEVVYGTDKYSVPLDMFNETDRFISFLETNLQQLSSFDLNNRLQQIKQSSYSASKVFSIL